MDDLEEDVDETKLKGYAEVTRVLEWLPKSPITFDPSFVRSLKTRLENGRDLTEKQLGAIRNIIVKFGVGGDPIRRRKPPTQRSPGAQYFKMTDATSHYY